MLKSIFSNAINMLKTYSLATFVASICVIIRFATFTQCFASREVWLRLASLMLLTLGIINVNIASALT